MCKVLEKIQNKSAEELLMEYGCNENIPVNLTTLLKNIGISALPMDFSKIENIIGCEKDAISGMVVTKNDNAAIFFKKNDTLNRQRFTIAHELAHCCLHDVRKNQPHVEFKTANKSLTEHEIEADQFARALLIPLRKLSEVHLSMSIPQSNLLANKFAVSVDIMEARLDDLKVSYYNRHGEPVVYGNE